MAVSVLGIDIGSYAAKAVKLGNIRDGRAALLGLGLSQLPPQSVPEWETKPDQAQAAVSLAMKNLVAHSSLSGKYVSASLSGDSIIVKKITMPAVHGDALKSRVMEEAEEYIPFAANDVNISYYVLEYSRENSQMSVLLAAAKKSVVQRYMEAIGEAGLKPAVLDVDGLALFNAYNFTRPGQRDEALLVDIGASALKVVVISQGLPMLLKDEPVGSRRLTSELAQAFHISEEDAEAVKFGSARAADQTLAAEIVDRAVCGWIAAVERVLDSARAETPAYKPAAIWLTGGGSLLRGLPEEFGKYFGLGAARLNPLDGLDYNPKKFDPDYLEYIGPQLAVSFGLALRKVEVE